MVLYCLTHGGTILRAIVHKFRYHSEEEAVFIVDKDASSLYCPRIDKIKYFQMPDPMGVADENQPVEIIKEQTDKVLSEFFKETDIDPLQFSHVYAMVDAYNPFILYFELNSVKYMLIEFADNQFNAYAKYVAATPIRFQKVIQELHLNDACGKNCIKAYLCSEESSRDLIEDKVEIEFYDFYGYFSNLDGEHRRLLIEGYRIEQYDFDAVMILNSISTAKSGVEVYRSAMPYKNMDEDPHGAFYSFYKTIFDYYFGGIDFAVKLHPESDEKYQKAFSEFKQLPKEVPMEMFFLLGKKFDIFCPASSTGFRIFEKNNYNVVNFGLSIFPFIRHIHFVFLAFTLINAVCTPSRIFVQDISPQQLDNFKKWVYTDFEAVAFEQLSRKNVKNAEFIVAGDPSDNFLDTVFDAPEDCLIIFSGSRIVDERLFTKQEMIYSIIDVSEAEEKSLRECGWTVMSKNKELVDALRDFSASYELEKSRMKIQTAPHS